MIIDQLFIPKPLQEAGYIGGHNRDEPDYSGIDNVPERIKVKKGSRIMAIPPSALEQFKADGWTEVDQDVAEGSQQVDSLVTDALKIMRGSDVTDAVQALKTVLGDREYNGRRGHYNFYVRQLVDMYQQQGVAEIFNPAQQKPLMAVALDKWKQAVLNRYPEARFATQKMINGATVATDRSGQVGIYDPKTSYAKVGPETQQPVSEGMPVDTDMGATTGGTKMTLGQWKQMWMKKMPGADAAAMFRSPPNMQGSAIAYFDGWMNNPDARWNPQQGVAEALELYFGKKLRPISEGNRNNRLRLMEEATFRNGYEFARLLVEKNITKDQVQQLFKSIETRATRMGQTGAGASNRTGLGKAKDVTTNVLGKASKLVQDAMQWARERPTMQAVDTEYNRAMTALGKLGGENGEANAITKAIYKYRDAAKKYPRATGLAKWAIISAASLVTGGLGGVGVAAGLAAIDAAIKDKDLVDIVGSGVQAAMVSGAIQGVGDLASAASGVPLPAGDPDFYNDTPLPAGDPDFYNDPSNTPPVPGEYSDAANTAYQQNPDPSDAPVDPNTRADYSQPDAGSSTYTVTADDVKGLGKIAQDNGLTAQQLWDANPQITNPDKIFIGQEINIPAASGEPVKNVWQDWEGPTKSTAPAVEPGPSDTVPPASTPTPAGDPDFNKIDYSKPGPVTTDSMGQKLEYNIPVNDQGSFKAPNPGLQPEELAVQKTAYDNWLADFKSRFPNAVQQPDGSWSSGKPGLAPMYPSNVIPGGGSSQFTPKEVAESVWSTVAASVRVKVLPNNLLIDNKLTVMAWALNESTNRGMGHSVQLTKLGVRTIFENIGRYRAVYLKEYVGAPTTDYGHPTAPGAPVAATAGQSKQGWFGKTLDTIGKGVDKVAGWAGNVGHNIITKVTADKLNNAWNREGEPYDSDKIYNFLLAQKVPKEVIDNVYQRMNLEAPIAGTPAPQPVVGKAQRQAYAGTNPATGKPWTVDELQARMQPAPTATKTTAGLQPALTGGPTAGLPPAPGPAPSPGKITQPNNTTSFNATNVMQMPGMEKYAKTATKAPANTANFGAGPTGYGKVTQSFKTPGTTAPTSAPTGTKVTAGGATADEKAKFNQRIAQALKQPVAEMLQMVETKEHVQRIKQFVDQTFTRYGAVNESAFAVRNQILEHVTQVGAQRRREHSQRVAH